MIVAKRKDGTSVRTGDRVLACWKNGLKFCGRIKSVDGIETFRSMSCLRLQTYTIRCDDGVTRPAHARHIKLVFNNSGIKRKRR